MTKKEEHKKEEHKIEEQEFEVKEPEVRPVKTNSGLSLDMLLAILLVLSLLGNTYLIFKVNSLNIELGKAKKTGTETTTIVKQTGGTETPTTAKATGGKKLTIRYFYSETCPYCTETTPVLEKLKKKFGDAIDLQKKCVLIHSGDDKLCIDKYGEDEFQSAMQEAQALGVQGTPTIYFGNELYQGARDELSFTKAACKTLSDNALCQNMPLCTQDSDCVKTGKVGKCFNSGEENAYCEFTDPVKVPLTVLNDRNCKSCDTSRIVETTKRLFPGLVLKELDYNTDEGRKLAKDLNIKALPAYIFDKAINQTPEFARVQSALIQVSESQYIINPQATGAGYYIGLEKKPNTLLLFVMSQCPYGVMAENNMKEVLDLFKDKINFQIHFIADDVGDGTFNSLHGQGEVDEDIRQVCAMKYAPKDYFNYILCRNKDIRNADWQSCANQNNIDAGKIKACSDGSEGKQLLSENVKLSGELGIGSSPTFLINNQVTFGGAMPAETIKSNFCGENTGLEGCNVTLSGASAGQASTGGCGS